MKPKLNLKGSQGHNVEPNKPFNQSPQSGSKKISYMSSDGSSKNYCGALEVNLKTCAKETKWKVYNWGLKCNKHKKYIKIKIKIVSVVIALKNSICTLPSK